MQFAFGLVLLCVAAAVQASAIATLFHGPRPDVVLLLVLALSMARGFVEGTIFGVSGGFLLDLLSAAPFGIHTALLGGIGGLTAAGEAYLFRGSMPLFMMGAAVATLILHGGSVLGLQLAGNQTVGLGGLVQFVVPTALINAALMSFTITVVQRALRGLAGWRQLEL